MNRLAYVKVNFVGEGDVGVLINPLRGNQEHRSTQIASESERII